MTSTTKTETNKKTAEPVFAGCGYLRPPEAADYTGHSESTLAKLRMAHLRTRGPAFIKRGGVILYRRADLDQWLESHLVGEG